MPDGYSYRREITRGCGCVDPINNGHMPECPRYGQTCEGCGVPAMREDSEGVPLCVACYDAAPLADLPTPPRAGEPEVDRGE